LNQVFSEANAPTQSIALGSVKSQIGHTKAAAGAASLIKATLALHHKVLPATLNITQPNPKLGIATSPFYLNTKTRPWMNAAGSTPRRAGVSSFGFGGTNFHIVLEEYESEPQQTYRLHSTVQSLLLAAPTPERLLERCQEMHQMLRADGSDREYATLVDVSKDLTLPLEVARLGFVAGSRADACNLLQLAIEQLRKDLTTVGWNHPLGIYYRKTGIATAGKVVALFSGQGSQYLDMGRELAINFPELRQGYSTMDQRFVQDGLTPLSAVVFPPPVFDEVAQQAQVADLQRTEYAQPAIGMFSTGLFKLLQQAGFNPDFVAGHSFGELTALWAAGVLNDADYAVLVKARGQAMAAPQEANFDAGAMLAIKGDLSRIEPLLQQFPDVTLANLNSAQQGVLAGARAEITQMHQILTDQADPTITAILLPVAAAFHTPRVAHAQKPFAQAIEAITFSRPTLPVYTNVTGERYPTEPEAIQTILKSHLTHQVFFQQEIEAIYADGGYCFIEFGPKQALTNLVKEILGNRPHEAIALNANWRKDSDRQLREAVIQLRVIGLALADLDPYQRERPIVEMSAKAKQLNVRLTATNYVSEKTKTGFDQALQDGHQVTFAVPPTDLNGVDPAVSLWPASPLRSRLNKRRWLTPHRPLRARQPPS
jgi:polyketide-type polyunsaturated fatty acid synthase PfaA